PGICNVDVKFEGMLSPFGIPVEANFISDDIQVVGGDSLMLKLKVCDTFAKFTLTNTANNEDSEVTTLYNVCVDMAEIVEKNENEVNSGNNNISDKVYVNDIEYVVAKYPSGLIEKIEWIDDSKNKTKSTIYLPVGEDPILTNNEEELPKEVAKYRTLEPQQAITGIIVYRLRENQ
ncbi:MAG: hypothetical protein K2G32_05055, partial [Oscillospiraceae bacterium]|nr:hypothetical protein [Oscillospiraceae bacterium]